MRGRGWLPSHWVRGAHETSADPAQPSRWERLLAELSLDDEQAFQVLGDGSVEAERIRRFALRRRFEVYVPEVILIRLGLNVDEDVLGRRGARAAQEEGE